MHFCQYWESLAVNWSHGYYTVGRLNGGMALKLETERKVDCPHKYLFSITQQTIPRSPSPSVSGAHSAAVSHEMASPWDFGNCGSAEREGSSTEPYILLGIPSILLQSFSLCEHLRDYVCKKNTTWSILYQLHVLMQMTQVNTDAHLCLPCVLAFESNTSCVLFHMVFVSIPY